MRARLYFILAFTGASILSMRAFAQINTDSLEAKILESIQNKAGKGKKSNYFDTSQFLGNLHGNLDKIFQQINREVAAGKSMGDIGKIKGGYYHLSALDSMRGNYKGAYENYKLYSLYRDSLQKAETEKKELQAKMQYDFDKKQAVAKAEQEKKDAEQKRVKNIQYFTIAGLAALVVVILIIALIQWRNSKQRRKANILLRQGKEEVESTLSELKSTQAQLIHAEKMASLGELTAGIAHEIQNPLNFVNNFSEVNNELIVELKTGMFGRQGQHSNANSDEGINEERDEILNDIFKNNEKIAHHGKRADAIVKSMLQHSRQATGVREPTDINALCDEYLKLAYHGMRARDKEFRADLKTKFDKNIGKINIVPQDIGRVLLNLFNNAFYATMEKERAERVRSNEGIAYHPAVSVETTIVNGRVNVIVRDNGGGISQEVIGKIFQPFFTTKPTGQGTGLGLSLAYDIIKAHGGEINVKAKEQEEGTEFTIQLPITD